MKHRKVPILADDSKKSPKSKKQGLHLPDRPDGLEEPTGFIDTTKTPTDPIVDLFDALQNVRQKKSAKASTALKEVESQFNLQKSEKDRIEEEITKFTQRAPQRGWRSRSAIWASVTVLFLGIYSWAIFRYAEKETNSSSNSEATRSPAGEKKAPREIWEEKHDGIAHDHSKGMNIAPPLGGPKPFPSGARETKSPATESQGKVKRWEPRQPASDEPTDEEIRQDYQDRLIDEDPIKPANPSPTAEPKNDATQSDVDSPPINSDDYPNNDEVEPPESVREDSGSFFED